MVLTFGTYTCTCVVLHVPNIKRRMRGEALKIGRMDGSLRESCCKGEVGSRGYCGGFHVGGSCVD